MDELKLIAEKIAEIKKLGHGEIVIKVKNGQVYRILTTEDKLIAP